MNKKIIISVLAGGGPANCNYMEVDHYEKMEQAARETCFKNPPENISIYYTYNRDGRFGIDIDVEDGESKLIDDRFYYGMGSCGDGSQSRRDPADFCGSSYDVKDGELSFLRRCIEFWGYCLNNFDFDYLLRPNLGCFVDLEVLNSVVSSLPATGVYGGPMGRFRRGRRSRSRVDFISGASILLSRDVVQLIWDAHITSEYGDTENNLFLKSKEINNCLPPPLDYDHSRTPDDVAIGCFLGAFRCHPHNKLDMCVPLTHIPHKSVQERDMDDESIMLGVINPKIYHYYYLHPKSPNCYSLMQESIEKNKKVAQQNLALLNELVSDPITQKKQLQESYDKFSIGNEDGFGDKGSVHSYIPFYNKIFNDYGIENISLLEVGAHYGYGIKMFNDFFIDSKIVGIEQDLRTCQNKRWEDIDIRICDATRVDHINKVLQKDENFDFIIDDASHQLEHQVKSFLILNTRLKDGGWYIIEDIRDIRSAEEMFRALLDFGGEWNLDVWDFRNIKNRSDDVLFALRRK